MTGMNKYNVGVQCFPEEKDRRIGDFAKAAIRRIYTQREGTDWESFPEI
jgi:hypothetical protein